MEDTDQIIITTLKQLGYQDEVPALSKLTGDDLKSITLFFLRLFKVDTRPFESKEGSQRYKIAQRISDALKKSMGLQADFMLLINPNSADVRKFLIAIISKFSNLGDEKPAETAMSFEERLTFERNQNAQNVLNAWLEDEWIIPDLRDESINQPIHHYVSFDKNTLRNKSFHELIPIKTPSVKQALYSQIASHFVKTDIGKQAFVGFSDNLRAIADNEPYSKASFVTKNRAMWDASKKENARLKRVTAAAREDKKQIKQVEQTPAQQQETTQYALELSYKQEESVIVASTRPSTSQNTSSPEKATAGGEGGGVGVETDSGSMETSGKIEGSAKKEVNFELEIEAIKEKHRKELDELSSIFNKNKDELQKFAEKMRDLEEKRTQVEEQLESEKIRSSEIQKSTEGLHELLGYLQDPKKSQKELEEQCQQFNREMDEMRNEWEAHRTKVTTKMENYKQKISENKERVEEMQSKISFMENDYENLISKTKGNQQLRANLQQEFVRMPKELTRNYFIKRITDVNANFKKQRNDLGKILEEVKDIEKTIDISASLMEKTNTEIENILRADSKPNAPTKAIYKLFNEFKKIFEDTIKNLKDQGSKKLGVRELEQKLDLLNAKNYKNVISKMQTDLQVLKEENRS